MKKLILLSLLFLAINIHAKEWKEVRIASEGDFPPFTATDKDGKLYGLEIDFANDLCKLMKVKCTIVAQDWDSLIPGLLAKKFDVIIAGMSITAEREKTISFSIPYLKGANSFVAKKGQFKDVSPKALTGKTIGVQKASISENFIRDNYKTSEIKTYESVTDAYLDLTAGRLDLVFNDTVNHYGSFLDKTEGKDYAVVGPEHSEEKWFGKGVGAGIRKEDSDLVAMFNKAIKESYKNGTFKSLNTKWVPKSNVMIKGY